MASASRLTAPDRRVIDDLPARIGVLPGETDLACQWLEEVLAAVVEDTGISLGDTEDGDES